MAGRFNVFKVSTVAVGCLAGFIIALTAINSQGVDLRPNRTSDLAQLVAQQATRNNQLAQEVETLREENDRLTSQNHQEAGVAEPSVELLAMAGLQAVQGDGLRVTLTDAPKDFAPPGVAGDLLVVHEHDIQVVVNALWAGGAEAMTIQGQRVTATTAVKCVGNTVVLHGTPYAPPYQIEAIGDQNQLEAALANDPAVQIYLQYAKVYQLGYQQQRLTGIQMPAYAGALPKLAQVER